MHIKPNLNANPTWHKSSPRNLRAQAMDLNNALVDARAAVGRIADAVGHCEYESAEGRNADIQTLRAALVAMQQVTNRVCNPIFTATQEGA